MPDAVKAKLQEIEQGELEEGAFDKGKIAETICDRITSGEYKADDLGEETVESMRSLVERLSGVLEESE
ncbi:MULTISPECIES: hypothetical protein [Halorussus]|uniref:hypothetical protein n=1 Tax=Halorussus TaxID=1070314 RepID=UPI000E2105DD|nr:MULTISPECIES: hypothetical protein [Halorussus]NHN59804.1 hypothetical protein [Halorussus sp. JP-T4]